MTSHPFHLAEINYPSRFISSATFFQKSYHDIIYLQVFYNEGEGKLVSVSPGPPMSDYLTSKLVADSLMWQQTFRNDSPSPEQELPPQPPLRPASLLGGGADLASPGTSGGKILVLDPGVVNDIEKEARRLATDVDALVENLACVLQVTILLSLYEQHVIFVPRICPIIFPI